MGDGQSIQHATTAGRPHETREATPAVFLTTSSMFLPQVDCGPPTSIKVRSQRGTLLVANDGTSHRRRFGHLLGEELDAKSVNLIFLSSPIPVEVRNRPR